MASSLRTELLNVSFGPRMLLDKVSFSVDPGQCWGIVGPNGVGKSTLMKTLSGLVVPDSGKVVVTPSSSTVGYLSQEPDRQVGEDVRAYLARRTGVTAASTALDAATMHLPKGLMVLTMCIPTPLIRGLRWAEPTSMRALAKRGPTLNFPRHFLTGK